MRHFLRSGAWLCASLVAAPALADERLPEATLRYDVVNDDAGSCPSEEALRQEVALRLGYDPFRDDAPLRVAVRLEKDASGYAARITTTTSGGPVAKRDIASGDSACEAIAKSVVLAVSLAIDPRGFGKTRRAPPPPVVEPPPAVEEPPPPSPALPARSPWNVEVEAGGRVGFGISPSVSLGPLLGARVGRSGFALLLEAGADLGLGTASKPGLAEGSVSASLLWAGVGACVTPSVFFFCARVDAGALEGSGNDLQAAHTATSAYAGLGVLAGLSIAPLGEKSGFRVGFRAELLAPFTRTTLYLENVSIWSTAPVAGGLGITLGYAF